MSIKLSKRKNSIEEELRNSVTDSELIDAVKGGDKSAFREIIKRHEGRVASTVYGMLGVCPEAEDVGQEVFIRLYRSINDYKGEAALSTYITRIAINLSLNEITRRKRRTFFSLDNWLENNKQGKSTEGEIYSFEEREIIEKALDKISPKYRSVLVLRLIESHTSEEAAAILDIPLGTVLSRMARGQKKLKSIITSLREAE